MERRGRGFVMSFILVVLFSQNLIPPVMCRKLGELSDQKNYYPSPHTGSSHGSGGHSSPVSHPTPPAPVVAPYTPTTPVIIPSTPTIFTPSPLIPFDPHFHFGTCNYWRSHPEAIWAVFGYWPGTVGQYFGAASGTAFGTDVSLPDALANTRHDGIGALFREGTASFLNSIADRNFPFTTQQVKDAFAAAVSSDAAAAAQAGLFNKANEGRLKFEKPKKN